MALITSFNKQSITFPYAAMHWQLSKDIFIRTFVLGRYQKLVIFPQQFEVSQVKVSFHIITV